MGIAEIGQWLAAGKAAIGTGQRAKLSPFQAIRNAVAAQPVGGIAPLPG